MTSTPDLDLSSILPSVRTEGLLRFTVAGRALDMDLRYQHERAYAAKLLLKARYPQSDIDTFLLRRFIQPGDAVLDAGANIGFTAVEMLQAGARTVLAVEPVPSIFERLESIRGDGVHVTNRAISDAAGSAPLILSTLHNQGSSLKKEITEVFPTVFGEAHQVVEVPLTTIDLLSEEFGYFDVWKLDVEGAEADALRGATRTLSAHPPRAIIAELYDRFFDEFHEIVRDTHPFAYRALIARDGYQLRLVPYGTRPDESVYQTSPMFVFTREAISSIRSANGSDALW